jgi:excisionase family DNA binding protein
MSDVTRQASYTTGEVARICHVTKRTVIQWIDSGKLKGYRIPGSTHRRVPADALRSFLRAYKIPDYASVVRRRILIVDDDTDLQELLKDALRERYDVEVAGSALEAASRLPVFQPDLVLLDIRLPDVSGLEVCRHFPDSKRARRVPMSGAPLRRRSRVELR